MTIAQLIEYLKQYDEDWDVTIGTDDGEGCVDITHTDVIHERWRIILRG